MLAGSLACWRGEILELWRHADNETTLSREPNSTIVGEAFARERYDGHRRRRCLLLVVIDRPTRHCAVASRACGGTEARRAEVRRGEAWRGA